MCPAARQVFLAALTRSFNDVHAADQPILGREARRAFHISIQQLVQFLQSDGFCAQFTLCAPARTPVDTCIPLHDTTQDPGIEIPDL